VEPRAPALAGSLAFPYLTRAALTKTWGSKQKTVDFRPRVVAKPRVGCTRATLFRGPGVPASIASEDRVRGPRRGIWARGDYATLARAVSIGR
jgi:hypothetical protein